MNPIIESMNDYARANRWAVDGGPARHLSGSQLEFPMIWHQPLALTGKIGRNEGWLTYKLSFLLLDKGCGKSYTAHHGLQDTLAKHSL